MNERPTLSPATPRGRRVAAHRAHILDAALACLLELGYAQASTLTVQRRADVSRGGLLHHFPSKDALFVAAAQHLASRRVAETGQQAATAIAEGDTDPARVDAAVAAMWERYREPYFRASVELWVASAHNAHLRLALLPEERSLNAAIRDVVDAMFGRHWAARPGFPELREVLLTSMRGVALADFLDTDARRHERHLAGWCLTARAVLAATG